MRSFKNMAVVAVLFVVFALGASVDQQVMAAGGGSSPYDRGNTLGGTIRVNNDLSYGSSCSGTGINHYSGDFWININPNKVSYDTSDWSFYTEPWDTSRWNASCYMHGLLNSSESWPQYQSWSQSLVQGVLLISENSYYDCREFNGKGYGANSQLLTIGGGFGIEPSKNVSSQFRYWEGADNHYDWPNGYDNPPVITRIPSWTAEFTMRGQFVAATPEEARAMGLQFAQGVPEPSTLLMLLVSGGILPLAVGGRGIRQLYLSLRRQ